MAYIPPDGDNVQFHFLTPGYTPPTGDAVNFNFTEEAGIRFHLGQVWEVVAGTKQDLGLDQQYVVEARTTQPLRLTHRWATEARQTAALPLYDRWKVSSFLSAVSRLTQQWETDFSRLQASRFTQQWLTDALNVQLQVTQQWNTRAYENVKANLDQQYTVRGVLKVPKHLTQQYAVFETPNTKLHLTQQWITNALRSQAHPLYDEWETFPVTSVLQELTDQWQTLVSSFEYSHLNETWRFTFMVAKALNLAWGNRIANDLGIVYPLGRTVIAQALDVVYPLADRVAKDVELDSTINTVDKVVKDVVLSHPIIDETPIQVTSTPTATINGVTITLDTASISFDEGQFGWTCDLVLFDPLHYALFNHDQTFTVDLLGETYTFIVDSKQFSRSSQVDISATITGISPSAIYAEPRAERITKTWPAVLVTDVVAELFGLGTVDWQILDWALPAGRLAVQDQSPMQILQTIAEAAGGIVETLPNGSIKVRYLYPISVPVFPLVTPDQEYNDNDHNFTLDERSPTFDLDNKLRIMDRAEEAQDIVEFELDEFDITKGIIKVWPQPWRDDVLCEHTSNNFVSVAARGVKTEEHTETVEVIAGKGNLAHPIDAVLNVEWLFVNLTGITFERDTNEFSTTHATLTESLVKITYRTRYHSFDAKAQQGMEVQFLVRDPV